MSRRDSDSFLPSGAIPSPPSSMPPSSSISPSTNIPRSMPMTMDSYISPHSISSHSPRNSSRSPARQPKPYSMQPHSNHSPSQNPPISPPKTRSASAENSSEALIEDWRNYTEKLRSQHEGEKAHMIADRKRMEEVMDEERGLWDQERNILKARILQLEQALEKRGRIGGSVRGSRDTSMNRIAPGMTQRQSIQQQAISFTSPGSNAVSVTGSVEGMPSRGVVPQESGRNADGSPFYAPAPRNPSRTFSSSSMPPDTLRVDDISAPRESAIRVTSKELKSSDFGPQSPPINASHRESNLDTIPETEPEPAVIPETIDISLIQPELEGVAIKASAVSPTFAAKVLSPQYSPSKLSPSLKPPGRDVDNHGSLSQSGSARDSEGRENGKGKVDLSVVMHAPVDRRLTMHAGHTPNHSISKFDFGESGSATPTQESSDHHPHPMDDNTNKHIHRPSLAHFDGTDEERGYRDVQEEDRELTGQLGLTNEKHKDDAFLAQLVEKLEEAKKSEGVSPSGSASSQSDGGPKGNRARMGAFEDEDSKDKEADDVPPLRLKPSANFGRPFGSM